MGKLLNRQHFSEVRLLKCCGSGLIAGFGTRSLPLMYRRLIVCLSALLVFPMGTEAGIYKYQDADGNWHFTDKPPKNQSVETLEGDEDPEQEANAGADSTTSEKKGNLTDSLTEKFDPKSPIEHATLAVVSIVTSMGGGSGFFVSADGFILTNRHVVRPTSSKEWIEVEKALREKQSQFRDAQRELKQYEKALKKDEERLEAYADAIRKESSSAARAAMTVRHDHVKAQLDARRQEFERIRKDVSKMEREYSRARSDYNIKSSLSKLAQSFKIKLKDDQELSARLIKISKDHDLALLKLDDYRTPEITRSDERATQGGKVFAIGSPLGMQDSVTSGVVTRHKDGLMFTDTQILPGNSGGPLLNENAEVIGVTTAKLIVTDVASQGFGVAIPIATAMREFSAELQNR